jgi:hydrogenase maturation protease
MRLPGTNILVCGFGNTLRKDDGLGPDIIAQLAERELPDNVALRDFGTSGFRAALEMGGFDKVIAIDAIKTGKKAGTLYRVLLSKEDVACGQSLNSFSVSLHESELERVLATTALLGDYPEEVIVVGCEPGDVSLGLTRSDAVSRATGEVIDMVIGEIDRLSAHDLLEQFSPV